MLNILPFASCPLCNVTTYNLYEYGTSIKICLDCSYNLLQPMHGNVVCVNCGSLEVEVIETYNKLKGSKGKYIRVLDEYFFCHSCDEEFYNDDQQTMFQYRYMLEDNKSKGKMKRGRKKKSPRLQSLINLDSKEWTTFNLKGSSNAHQES